MLGVWRPGSEGDWCLCHPSRELPLSWCIMEPLNQLPPSLSPPSFLSRMEKGSQKWKKKKGEAEIDREVKVTSLSFSYLHLRWCRLGQQWLERWKCGHSCQALTVHCVKLVMISSWKRPSCSAPLLGARRHRGPWSRMCRGGKSLLWRGGKHYGQLYRHRLLWHIQKWANKFADWQRRDGRSRGRSGATARQQMFTRPPLQALGRSGHARRC